MPWRNRAERRSRLDRDEANAAQTMTLAAWEDEMTEAEGGASGWAVEPPWPDPAVTGLMIDDPAPDEPGRLRRPSAEPGRLRRPSAEPGRLWRPSAEPGRLRRPPADPAADGDAARAFRQAAVRLDGEPQQSDGAAGAARAAGAALVRLARAGDEATLGTVLRPDPGQAEVTWTIACYRIGDLTPCTLQDFSDPVAAVNALAAEVDASLVAAEMLASTPDGNRWTALTRTGESVTFQLPAAGSASDATSEHPGEQSLAIEHWRQQLSRWAAGDAGDSSVGAPHDVSPAGIPGSRAVDGPAPAAGDDLTVARAGAVSREELGQVRHLVVEALRSIQEQFDDNRQRTDEIFSHLASMERRLDDLHASIATTGTTLEGRLQSLAEDIAGLDRGQAARYDTAAARTDARFDELGAQLAGPSEHWLARTLRPHTRT